VTQSNLRLPHNATMRIGFDIAQAPPAHRSELLLQVAEAMEVYGMTWSDIAVLFRQVANEAIAMRDVKTA
jgi:hypothetical protein